MKNATQAPTSDVPFGVPGSFDEHIKLMYDLNAVAFQGDITRVSTLMIARDLSSRSFPGSGFEGSWHGASHHDEDPKNLENYARLNRYHTSHLAYFVEKLRSTPDGDGNLLDHSLIYYGSNMSNSNRHDHTKVTAVLVGGASGRLKGNRYLVFADDKERTSNLLLSLMELCGVHRNSIGDSTGHLEV